MQVIVNELLTNYSIQGKGSKTIVLLHGWGDNLKTFDELSSKLAQSFQIIRLDLPGFGQTQTPDKAWSLKDYALFVRSFMKKVGEHKPYAIIGHSNGGAIAIKIISADLIKPNKLILLSSSGIRSTNKTQKKMIRIIAKTGKLPVKLLPTKYQNIIKQKTYKAIGSDAFVAENLHETFKKVVSEDMLEDTAKIKIPTLLIYGSNDEATPPAYGEIYERAIAGSKLKIIPNTGHFIHHDASQVVYDEIYEFLNA